MKILLVGINAKFAHTNIAIRYIKAYCSRFNIVTKEYTVNDSINSALKDILGLKPDVVGFSCYIWNIEFILKLCSNLKKISSNTVIILGGPEVSFDAKDFMINNPFVDYILKGEAEVSSEKLFDYISKGNQLLKNINGLVYRKGEEVIENELIELIDELDSIPFPYLEEDDLNNKIVYYESSRGCPYNCTYCLSSTSSGVRFFSLCRVKRDLLWLISKEVKLVKFVDRTFNCSRYSLEIMKFLMENSKNTRFHFEISAEALNEETIEFLRTVPDGIFQFEIGVQSTNNTTLKHINRSTDLKKLSDNVRKLREINNIHLHLDLIAGLPGEDYSSFGKSFDDVIALRPHMLQLGFLKLLKGSKARQDAEKYGIVYTGYPPYEVLKTQELSFDELSELKSIEEIVDRYYNSGRFSVTLKYMLTVSNSPFEMFKGIMIFEKGEESYGRNINNIGQYKLLFDYCCSVKIYDESIFKECLAFDYLFQGRNPVVPEFLLSDNPVSKEFIWDFLSNKENVVKFLPHYEGNDVKNIIKKVYVRAFNTDISDFINNGRLSKKNNSMFFDYGCKNKSGQIYYFSI